ncbi:MAG: ferredoxin [Dongiaceae bacterium]
MGPDPGRPLPRRRGFPAGSDDEGVHRVRREDDMKIRIDKARCVGNARCAAVSAALFPLDDDGYIAVEEIDVPAGQEELARRGARACPERIIVVED